MNQSVVAVFESQADAERAREDLSAGGVPAQCMSLHAGDTSGDVSSGTKPQTSPGTQIDTETGIGHFFRSIFGLEDDRPDRYEEAARRGHATLVIDCQNDEEIEQIRMILDRHDVIDIDERAAEWDAQSHREGLRGDVPAVSASGKATRGGAREPTETQATIPVVEEQIAVGKRQVEAGRVRVYTRVLERPVEETVQLREERARIERRPVDRPATEADLAEAFKEGSMEIHERAEVPVVEKRARVVEEVQVGKDVRERTETVRDKVHKTDVRVEEEAPTAAEDAKTRGKDKPRPR